MGTGCAGKFLQDSATLIMTTDANLGGDVKLVDSTTGAIRPVTFERPKAAEGGRAGRHDLRQGRGLPRREIGGGWEQPGL